MVIQTHSVSQTDISNWIGGKAQPACSGQWLEKYNPANEKVLSRLARSNHEDVARAVESAKAAQPAWATLAPVRRGEILHELAAVLKQRQKEIARVVHLETGKSMKDAMLETDAAIQQGFFMAGEGWRLYGNTLTSAMSQKFSLTIREPLGVAGLIIAANTPIANIAWKVFPALICGNAAIVKAAEDAPQTAHLFAQCAQEASLPDGVLNILQGLGEEAGAPLAAHPDIAIVSFTGSTQTGREIAKTCAGRLARVSLELGGKNPFVVCEDARLENACSWALLSAFSNAGQRCASASRIIIFDSIYNRFREMLIEKTQKLKIGTADSDDLGPLINERQLNRLLEALRHAQAQGASLLAGGERLERAGYFMAPTLIDSVSPESEISKQELFGPIACLYRVKNFDEALRLANDSPYGLTACVHTQNIDRAIEFSKNVQAGVTIVNGGTHGSEPHMPFGGVKQSGNGTREPGKEALDVYSNLKAIHILSNKENL